MIKNYNLFLINEGITMSNEDIVDILISLETEDNRNAALINKLVNHKDNKGVTVLMNIVKSNKEDLVDYVLKFNPDINALTKLNENVLFFCKNINMFNKFFNLGVDYKIITTYEVNTLLYLASKNIFNEEMYQKLINNGVEINKLGLNKTGLLDYLVTNKKAVEFLIKNKIDLNIEHQMFINNLFYKYKYYPKTRKNIIEIFDILFKNGIKINQIYTFVNQLVDPISYAESNYNILRSEHVYNFISKIGKYFSDELIIELYKHFTKYIDSKEKSRDFAIKLLDTGNRQYFYDFLKKYWGTQAFYIYFEDYIKEYPYLEDVTKYNL